MYKNNDFFMIVTRQWKKICNFARKFSCTRQIGSKIPFALVCKIFARKFN